MNDGSGTPIRLVALSFTTVGGRRARASAMRCPAGRADCCHGARRLSRDRGDSLVGPAPARRRRDTWLRRNDSRAGPDPIPRRARLRTHLRRSLERRLGAPAWHLSHAAHTRARPALDAFPHLALRTALPVVEGSGRYTFNDEAGDERGAARAREILAADLTHPDPATLLVSQRKVMWQAPPTWPQVPLGKFPRRGWRPDPAWGPAPAGWRFIRADSYALADYLDDTDAALTQSPAAVEVLLNTNENYLVRAMEGVRRMGRMSTLAAKLGLHPPDDERVRAAVLGALLKVRSEVAQMRLYVLGALSWGPAFGMELSRRRRELAQACSMFATFAGMWRLHARLAVFGAQLADSGRQPKKRARFYAEDQAAAAVLAPFEGPFDSSVPGRCAGELRERGFGILRPVRVHGEVVVRGNQVFARVHVDDTCPARKNDIDAPPYFERGRAALVHFSAGGFSRGALELAARKNIALFHVAETVTAANDAAVYLWTPTPH